MKITRRRVLQTAAVAAPSLGVSWAATAPSPVILQLGEYMAAAAGRAIPEEAVEKTKHHILDTFAAMISGTTLPPGKAALQFAKLHGGEKTVSIAGSTLLCGAIDGAMVNGMLAHSDETDDSHAPAQCHPGCATIPAAFAAAEEVGNVDGTRFLRAVALGYDIGTRVTMTLGALPFQMETHHSSHSIAETFCAAAAAASVAGLSSQQMRWILDYAAQQAAGVAAWQRDSEHIEKSLVFAGWPARNGVTAALLMQAGATGVDDIMTGTDNFLLAFNPKAKVEGLVDKLGERYEITRTNIKKWTVGSPIQAPLDAMEAIRQKHPFEAAQVKAVTARLASSDANTVNNRDMPDICVQHLLAVMLLDRTASFAAAHDRPRMKDPAVLAERAKINLVFDEALEKLHPVRAAIVEVELLDGTKWSERVEAVRGTAENPMTRDEVATKARDLMAPVVGAAKAAKLIDRIWHLEQVKNVRELRASIQTS